LKTCTEEPLQNLTFASSVIVDLSLIDLMGDKFGDYLPHEAEPLTKKCTYFAIEIKKCLDWSVLSQRRDDRSLETDGILIVAQTIS